MGKNGLEPTRLRKQHARSDPYGPTPAVVGPLLRDVFDQLAAGLIVP